MAGALADLVTFAATALLVALLSGYVAATIALLLRATHPWRWAWRSPPILVGLAWAVLLGAAWTWAAVVILRLAERLLVDPAAHGPAWHRVWWTVMVIAAIVVPVLAILRQALATADSMARIAVLLATQGRFETDPHTRSPTAPQAGFRRIVICCDGTDNSPDRTEDGRPATTNVYKLSQALCDNDTQTVWYDPGVGTGTSSESGSLSRLARYAQSLSPAIAGRVLALGAQAWKVVEGATGSGITENVTQAYTEIVRQYQPNDRIYLFGFSRGAYTARCVAGVIARCGLLKAENIRFAEDTVRLYRTRRRMDQDVPIAPDLVHDRDSVAIETLGVFDTVAALGAPLWGWWFRVFVSNRALETNPAPICLHVYHALSMDERRATFFPTLFSPQKDDSWTETLEQVWFRGAHADIGGGYAETGLSDITLGWMVERGARHGLDFKPGYQPPPGDGLARMHDELRRQPFWRLLGSWPRWHPVAQGSAAAPFGTLHESVLDRAAELQERYGRIDLLGLAETDPPLTFVTQAHREWDRTGIVIDGHGASYELRWIGGEWRDSEDPRCGPSGQAAGAWDARRVLGWRKRIREARWMTLCASIAHPRVWKLRERGFLRLLRYLFWQDPRSLRMQVAPIGEHLGAAPGGAVVLQNNAEAGLLYLFANDWWQTAPNNSGGLVLQIRRLAAHEAPSGPTLVLAADGTWR